MATGAPRLSDPRQLPGVRHRSVQANGLRFHVAECGEGDRLALLLHGFPECWFSWRHQMPLLARLGHRVWAVDMRGYGGSERPRRRADYHIDVLAGDVAGLLDAAGARESLIVAHDWGAIVAWYFAMHRVREIDRLVILNVPHPARWRSPTLRQRLRSWYILFFQIPWLPERLLTARGARAVADALRSTAVHPECFGDEELAVFREEALRPGAAKAMIDYYRALVLGGGLRRLRARGFPPIDVPTLLIWGERDVALGPELARGTEAWVRDLTLRTLPRASHWVQQDAPDVVNAMLEAWLLGRPVPEAPG